jgi:hypothetical protein
MPSSLPGGGRVRMSRPGQTVASGKRQRERTPPRSLSRFRRQRRPEGKPMPVRRRTSGVAASSGEPPESVRRVVIAVPAAAAAERLRKSLGDAGFIVSAQSSTAAEAVAAVAAHRPSLCLFASELAEKEFFPIQEMSRTSPGTRVVVLARRGAAQEMVGVLRAGAAGYVPAMPTGKRLIDSLDLILPGYTPLPGEFLSELRQPAESADELAS